jgi:hypothetical protein
MDAEKEFVKKWEFEKNIVVLMSEYFNQFNERLTAEKYKQMIKNYYAEEGVRCEL